MAFGWTPADLLLLPFEPMLCFQNILVFTRALELIAVQQAKLPFIQPAPLSVQVYGQ